MKFEIGRAELLHVIKLAGLATDDKDAKTGAIVFRSDGDDGVQVVATDGTRVIRSMLDADVQIPGSGSWGVNLKRLSQVITNDDQSDVVCMTLSDSRANLSSGGGAISKATVRLPLVKIKGYPWFDDEVDAADDGVEVQSEDLSQACGFIRHYVGKDHSKATLTVAETRNRDAHGDDDWSVIGSDSTRMGVFYCPRLRADFKVTVEHANSVCSFLRLVSSVNVKIHNHPDYTFVSAGHTVFGYRSADNSFPASITDYPTILPEVNGNGGVDMFWFSRDELLRRVTAVVAPLDKDDARISLAISGSGADAVITLTATDTDGMESVREMSARREGTADKDVIFPCNANHIRASLPTLDSDEVALILYSEPPMDAWVHFAEVRDSGSVANVLFHRKR